MTEKIEIAALDYDGKVKLLERIAQEFLDLRVASAQISGEHARIQAELRVLREVKSALQSAIKAEQAQ